MKINNKKRFSAGLMTTLIASATFATTAMATTSANNNLGTPEQQADITNWIANTPAQVSNNMAMQHINPNNLNGVRYVIQWGDTLSSISEATGISVAKLCYDNHIENANFIYAGNVLILNKDGYVPDNYQPRVDPYTVAQTKVTINNGPTFVNIDVQPGAIKEYYDNSDNSNHSTNIYKAGDNTSSQSTTNNNSSNASSKSSSDDSSSDSSSDSVSASTVVDGLNKANSNDKLSFTEGSDGTELSVSSDDIAKAVKDDDYSSLLDEITSALDSDKEDEDVTISISGDGDDLHVYASYSKSDDDEDKQSSDDSSKDEDSQSSDKDEDNDSQSSDDEDSQSDDDDDSNKADTNDDEDTDTTTDDE